MIEILKCLHPEGIMLTAVGLAWGFLLVQWVDFILQAMAIRKDPLPLDLNLADRTAVGRASESVVGNKVVARHVRTLLEAWGRGATPDEVVELANSQSARDARRLFSALWFVVLVMIGGFVVTDEELKPFAAMGLGVAGATYFLYTLVLGRVERYIEENILDKLPGTVPGLGMTAKELAQELGGAIDKAFRDYVPQPEKIAAAVAASVDIALKNAASGMDAAQKKMAEAHDALAAKWAAQQKDTLTAIEAAKKAIEALSAQMGSAMGTASEKWQVSLGGLTDKMEKSNVVMSTQIASGLNAVADKLQAALAGHADKIEKSGQATAQHFTSGLTSTGEKIQAILATHALQVEKSGQAATQQLAASVGGASDKMQGALSGHAAQVEKANMAIVAQLDKIQALGKDIEKLFQLQKAVDGTITAVATTAEFKATLDTLRKHIAESDELIRSVAKPRTIRLVESQGAQG